MLVLPLLFAISSCASDVRHDAAKEVGEGASSSTVQRARSDTAHRSACDTARAGWTPLAYSDVDLGPRVHGGVGYIPGPETVATIRSQEEWSRVWKRIADTVPAPKVELRDSILVVLATKEFTGGPVGLDIVRVRHCRVDGSASVEYRLRSSTRAQDYGDRAIRAIAVPRSTLGSAPVHFVLLPEKVDD